ncbi:hypothetical protein SCL_0534 [Sulfuricaulis limicola]|uniref:Uncharacterized protein n=1 Tax=Sulfuricaulis limicola TaxID=1620215 RepID=A0A1B4XDJ2_9GAMM|nr:hypothetical protein SCL_0534 [Sulfuricaulis limicola]
MHLPLWRDAYRPFSLFVAEPGQPRARLWHFFSWAAPSAAGAWVTKASCAVKPRQNPRKPPDFAYKPGSIADLSTGNPGSAKAGGGTNIAYIPKGKPLILPEWQLFTRQTGMPEV